jgi:hypothetical protein
MDPAPPIRVNRAPALTLWAAVVAERLGGHPPETALTLGRFVAGSSARAKARRLVEHLERAGYVVMHKPPLGQHGAPGNLAGWTEKVTKVDRGE